MWHIAASPHGGHNCWVTWRVSPACVGSDEEHVWWAPSNTQESHNSMLFYMVFISIAPLLQVTLYDFDEVWLFAVAARDAIFIEHDYDAMPKLLESNRRCHTVMLGACAFVVSLRFYCSLMFWPFQYRRKERLIIYCFRDLKALVMNVVRCLFLCKSN